MTMTVNRSQPLLRIENLAAQFGTGFAVHDASLEVHSGEILGIVGESGSGKSITCRAVLGLLPRGMSASGRILFDGQDIISQPVEALRKLRGREISMIFQNPASHLDPLMSIGRHVAEPLRMHLGHSAEQARQQAIQLLDDVQIHDPEHRVDAYPHELSGGMKQRAMIASAIASSPRLLLADEPTTALDVTVQSHILELLKSLNTRLGLSIILVSHDLGVVAEVCDRVVVMRDGRVVESGATDEIIHTPKHAYTRLLIDSRPGRNETAHRLADTDVTTRIQHKPLLEARDISVRFVPSQGIFGQLLNHGTDRSVAALDKVGFSVEQGETLGIVGESGSGKSTMAHVITRLLEPTAGAVRFRGAPIHKLKGSDLSNYRRAVQMVFQNPFDSLNPRMTAREIVAEPIRYHKLATGKKAEEMVFELLELVELPLTLADRRPRQLSGGQCQRVGIARALALDPEILIADEVTSALDVTIQSQILALLRNLRRQRNLTIVYISHDLSVVREFCDRVIVLQSGRLIETGPAEEVLLRPKASYTQTLVDSIPVLNALKPVDNLTGQVGSGSP